MGAATLRARATGAVQGRARALCRTCQSPTAPAPRRIIGTHHSYAVFSFVTPIMARISECTPQDLPTASSPPATSGLTIQCERTIDRTTGYASTGDAQPHTNK